MKAFQGMGHVGLALIILFACTVAGCQKPDAPDSTGPSSDLAPSEETTSSEEATPTEDVMPSEEATPPKEAAPKEEEAPAKEVAPKEEVAPAKEATPKEEAAPAKEAASKEEVAPAKEAASMKETPPQPPAVGKLVALPLDLPAPAFRGTPIPLEEPNVEPPLGKPRAPFLAPEGTMNLAAGRAISTSDPAPTAGEVDYVTDGDKEASDFGYLELRPGGEWVQVDLGEKATIFAVLVWHNHAEARVYRDVIVQVSDDPDFLEGRVVFNNDYDNSSGMGVGADKGYVETSEGKLIDCKGIEGRYVRFWSKGSHVDEKNHYTEVEVFGRPAA